MMREADRIEFMTVTLACIGDCVIVTDLQETPGQPR